MGIQKSREEGGVPGKRQEWSGGSKAYARYKPGEAGVVVIGRMRKQMEEAGWMGDKQGEGVGDKNK